MTIGCQLQCRQPNNEYLCGNLRRSWKETDGDNPQTTWDLHCDTNSPLALMRTSRESATENARPMVPSAHIGAPDFRRRCRRRLGRHWHGHISESFGGIIAALLSGVKRVNQPLPYCQQPVHAWVLGAFHGFTCNTTSCFISRSTGQCIGFSRPATTPPRQQPQGQSKSCLKRFEP